MLVIFMSYVTFLISNNHKKFMWVYAHFIFVLVQLTIHEELYIKFSSFSIEEKIIIGKNN